MKWKIHIEWMRTRGTPMTLEASIWLVDALFVSGMTMRKMETKTRTPRFMETMTQSPKTQRGVIKQGWEIPRNPYETWESPGRSPN